MATQNSMDRGAWWAIVHEVAKMWQLAGTECILLQEKNEILTLTCPELTP